MKVITETVDKKKYVELVLTDFNMDIIESGRVLSKTINIGKQEIILSIRLQTMEEKYAAEEI